MSNIWLFLNIIYGSQSGGVGMGGEGYYHMPVDKYMI